MKGETCGGGSMDEVVTIPESVAVGMFNERTGADCKTVEETVAYLQAHPKARALLAHGKRTKDVPTDTEMLDWLVKQGPPGATDGMGLNEETWEASYSTVQSGDETDGQCVRAAIARAMRTGR